MRNINDHFNAQRLCAEFKIQRVIVADMLFFNPFQIFNILFLSFTRKGNVRDPFEAYDKKTLFLVSFPDLFLHSTMGLLSFVVFLRFPRQ